DGGGLVCDASVAVAQAARTSPLLRPVEDLAAGQEVAEPVALLAPVRFAGDLLDGVAEDVKGLVAELAAETVDLPAPRAVEGLHSREGPSVGVPSVDERLVPGWFASLSSRRSLDHGGRCRRAVEFG